MHLSIVCIEHWGDSGTRLAKRLYGAFLLAHLPLQIEGDKIFTTNGLDLTLEKLTQWESEPPNFDRLGQLNMGVSFPSSPRQIQGNIKISFGGSTESVDIEWFAGFFTAAVNNPTVDTLRHLGSDIDQMYGGPDRGTLRKLDCYLQTT